MMSKVLNVVMDWALSRPINAGKSYEGEQSPGWAYTIKDDTGSPYLSRLLLPRMWLPFIGSFRPMLHKFHRPDDDTLHDHPWDWARSFVLSGAYLEERLTEVRFVGGNFEHVTAEKLVTRFNSLSGQDYHRITKLFGEVFTLFISGERTKDWGFLVNGDHIPWREYLGK